MANDRWDILALPGVEVTHVPVEDIDFVAKESKAMGARLVLVHGETIVEPVSPGTNLAAVNSKSVDILAHPGIITDEEASIAAVNGIFLEVSARPKHAMANGHVVKTAFESGARVILDSDTHEPTHLMTRDFAMNTALGAGLGMEEAKDLLDSAPRELLARIDVKL